MEPRPLVVDANSLLVRCIMASITEDQTSGLFHSGFYGATNTLADTVRRAGRPISQIVACFDNGYPPARTALIPGYKDHRDRRFDSLTEEEFDAAFDQIHRAFDLWPHLGISCLSYDKREADDVVVAAVRLYASYGCSALALTSDLDVYQAVLHGGEVVDFGRTRVVSSDNFEVEVGTWPSTFILYRTLVGDSSDNIKGAHGVGPKRAGELIEWLVERTGDVLFDLEPKQQLDVLVETIESSKDARPSYVDAVVQDHVRLRAVAQGIDMRDSFGPLRILRNQLRSGPAFDSRAFLKGCRSLGLWSILGDPERFLSPFREAVARMHQKPPLGSPESL